MRFKLFSEGSGPPGNIQGIEMMDQGDFSLEPLHPLSGN